MVAKAQNVIIDRLHTNLKQATIIVCFHRNIHSLSVAFKFLSKDRNHFRKIPHDRDPILPKIFKIRIPATLSKVP